MAKKLCRDTNNVSCHCFVKQTANTACSSGFLQNGKTEINSKFFLNEINNYSDLFEHLQNHSLHSDCECNSGANFVKNSVILSCFPATNAVTKYNFNKLDSNFLTAASNVTVEKEWAEKTKKKITKKII